MKDIIEAIKNKDYYDPENIFTILRYKILNEYLVNQASLKLGLVDNDNHGGCSQWGHDACDGSETPVAYPREFRQQFKHFSSFIVDVGSAPMRILLNMILGSSRSIQNAAAKAVEDRVVDAILSCADELAFNMRAFNRS